MERSSVIGRAAAGHRSKPYRQRNRRAPLIVAVILAVLCWALLILGGCALSAWLA